MENGQVFEKLIKICHDKHISVLFTQFKANYGLIRGDRIGIANDMGIDAINKTLAHEIAHSYLHYDKGNITGEQQNEAYEEQADRAALMLLETIQIAGGTQG